MPAPISQAEAVAFIRGTHGKIFSVCFTKRSDGSIREMVCRTEVYSHVRGDLGSGPAYNPKDHGLLRIFDMHKKGYRSLPIDGLLRIKIGGEWIPIVPDAVPCTTTTGV